MHIYLLKVMMSITAPSGDHPWCAGRLRGRKEFTTGLLFAYDCFRPAAVPVNMMIIRPMTEQDLDQVLATEAASFAVPWSRGHFLHEMRSPLSFPLVAEDGDGGIAGFICPMQVLDEGQILDLAVSPACRGRGIGKSLVERALQTFRLQGASFVGLEVRPSNTAALHLYSRCGFVAEGRRKGYYENGEDAILMSCKTGNRGEENSAF
jgi:ribosomal-protein-alanine N-acetyltransferase